MPSAATLPCIPLPNPKPMTFNLPFGGQLQSVMDISKGPPSDCTLVHGLMLQLGPALAGIECFIKLSKIISALSKISVSSLPDIASAAADFVQTCVPVPLKFACTIIDVLKLLVAYLKCLITALLSVLEFQVGIDLTAAQDNPVLLASLNCAQNNTAASMSQLKDAIAIVESILSLVQPVLDFAEDFLPQPAKDGLKTMNDVKSTLETVVSSGGASAGLPGVQDTVQKLQNLKSDLEQLQGILDELSC